MLFDGVQPAALRPIRLSIGEPQHRTPELIREAIASHLDGLAVYPTTAGLDALREAVANWFVRRYGLAALDPATQVLPVNGTREALFAFAQAVIDRSRRSPLVVCPNPFYQIYEGAALLAGAEVAFLNQTADRGFALDFDSLDDEQWSRTAADVGQCGQRGTKDLAGRQADRLGLNAWNRPLQPVHRGHRA